MQRCLCPYVKKVNTFACKMSGTTVHLLMQSLIVFSYRISYRICSTLHKVRKLFYDNCFSHFIELLRFVDISFLIDGCSR